jgi:hypothetical protein
MTSNEQFLGVFFNFKHSCELSFSKSQKQKSFKLLCFKLKIPLCLHTTFLTDISPIVKCPNVENSVNIQRSSFTCQAEGQVREQGAAQES